MKKELTFEITQHHGVISEKSKGWRREINSVSWNGAEPKYDIRDWDPTHEKMGKGIVLTETELRTLMEIVETNIFGSEGTLDSIDKENDLLWNWDENNK